MDDIAVKLSIYDVLNLLWECGKYGRVIPVCVEWIYLILNN